MLYIGTDCPDLRDLYTHVVPRVADKWRDLGIRILPVNQLDIIAANYPNDVERCCKSMFELWLKTKPNATTWDQLIDALFKCNLNALAENIKDKLSKNGMILVCVY